jgi:hypothetical protein
MAADSHGRPNTVSHWVPLLRPPWGHQTLARRPSSGAYKSCRESPLARTSFSSHSAYISRPVSLAQSITFSLINRRPTLNGQWLPCAANRSPTAVFTNLSSNWNFSPRNLQSLHILHRSAVPLALTYLPWTSRI